jgi:hypothetical protein
MCLSNLYDKSRIVPSPKRLVCCNVNRPFSFWTGDGDGKICFSGCAINICVSRNEESLCDGGAENFNHGRVHPGSRQGVFVNISGFHRAEDDQRDRANKSDEQYQNTEAASRHEPLPVSRPPVGSWCQRNRRILLHGTFLLQSRSLVQSFLQG